MTSGGKRPPGSLGQTLPEQRPKSTESIRAVSGPSVHTGDVGPVDTGTDGGVGGPSGQSALEMCADNYAHKWGFREEIEDNRDERTLFHYGPRPNSEITEIRSSGVRHRFRITRNFTKIYVQSETEDGKPLTGEQVRAATERFLRRARASLARRKTTAPHDK